MNGRSFLDVPRGKLLVNHPVVLLGCMSSTIMPLDGNCTHECIFLTPSRDNSIVTMHDNNNWAFGWLSPNCCTDRDVTLIVVVSTTSVDLLANQCTTLKAGCLNVM